MNSPTTITALLVVASATAALGQAVPPTQEIEVLDPNVDPFGRPAVQVVPGEHGRPSTIEIAPVVLVHRFYYTGSRDFQGPLLPGGPSILVVNHPRTHERLYVEAQMLPGAPRVHYRPSGIVYDYGEQCIRLKFPLIGGPCLEYGRESKLVKSTVGAAGAVAKATGVPTAVKATANTVGHVMETAGGRAKDAARFVAGKAKGAIRRTPIARVLVTTPEDRATRERSRLNERAASERRRLEATIPTNR